MEKFKDQITEMDNIRRVLFQIKNYAIDHQLTAEQIEDIFNEGIVASFKKGKIQLPSYPKNMLPGVDDIKNLDKRS